MKTIEYRTIDKSKWERGPWDDEPDKVQWQDPETGLPCLIVRNSVGALCGYVGIAPDHPLHGKGYDDADDAGVNVHGGLSFAAACREGAEDRGICHLPEPGEPDAVWWFGFDCAHAFDMSPNIFRRGSYPSSLRSTETYRDRAYVENECRSLARQLKEMAG